MIARPAVLGTAAALLLAAPGEAWRKALEVVGALGVSGAPGGDNDALCAKAGLGKISDRLKQPLETTTKQSQEPQCRP